MNPVTQLITRAPEPDTPAPRRQRLSAGRLRWWGWLAAVAVAAGVVLRFVAVSPLWLDEAQTVAISRLPLPELFQALREDGSPPLYYLLLHAWMELFGSGDLAVRSLSGILAVAALPLFHRLAGPGPAAGLLLVLAAVNPWLIRYATEARMYSLQVLLVMIGLLVLRWVLSRPGPGPAAGLALVVGLLLLTHYWALFLYAAGGVAVLVAAVRHRSSATAWALAGWVGGSLLLVPWLPSFWHQLQHTGTPWADRTGPAILINLVSSWASGGVGPANALLLVLWPLMIWGVIRSDRRLRTLAVVGAGTLVIGFLVSWVTYGAVVSRYTAVVVPIALLIVVHGVVSLPRRWSTVAATGLVLAWLGTDVLVAASSRTQAGTIAAAVNARATAGDTVVFCPDQLAPAVIPRLGGQPRVLTYPEQRNPGRLDWTDYERRVTDQDPAATASAAVSRGGPVWLVAAETGYKRPFDGRCQVLARELSARLGGGELIVAEATTSGNLEHAALWRWSGPTGR